MINLNTRIRIRFRMRILIQQLKSTQIHADLDPQPCFRLYKVGFLTTNNSTVISDNYIIINIISYKPE